MYTYPIGSVMGITVVILTHYLDLYWRTDRETGEIGENSWTQIYSALYVSIAVGTLSFVRVQTFAKNKADFLKVR